MDGHVQQTPAPASKTKPNDDDDKYAARPVSAECRSDVPPGSDGTSAETQAPVESDSCGVKRSTRPTYRRPTDDRNRPRRSRSWNGRSTGLDRYTAVASTSTSVVDEPQRFPQTSAAPEDHDLRVEWNRIKRKRSELLRSLEHKSLELAKYREAASRAEEARLRHKADRAKQRLLERVQRDLARQELERQNQEQQERERLELEQQEREQQQRARQKQQERARQKQEQETGRQQGRTQQPGGSRPKQKQQERVQQESTRLKRARPDKSLETQDRRGSLTTDRLPVTEEPQSDYDCSSSDAEEYEWDQANGPSRFASAHHRPPVRQQQKRPTACLPPPSVSSESLDDEGCEDEESDNEDRATQDDYCY